MHINIPATPSPYIVIGLLLLVAGFVFLGGMLFVQARRHRSSVLAGVATLLMIVPLAGALVGANGYFTQRAVQWQGASASVISEARASYGVRLSSRQAGQLLSGERVILNTGAALKLKHTGDTYALTGGIVVAAAR
jgi:hypothetical protein